MPGRQTKMQIVTCRQMQAYMHMQTKSVYVYTCWHKTFRQTCMQIDMQTHMQEDVHVDRCTFRCINTHACKNAHADGHIQTIHTDIQYICTDIYA